jgi:hypothetical protein
MKGVRYFITLLILQLPAPAAASQTPREQEAAESVRITLTEKISIRSKPDAKADILVTLEKGDTVEVIDYSAKTMFYTLKLQDRIGYVSAADLPQNTSLRRIIKRAIERAKMEKEKRLTEMRKAGIEERESTEYAAKLQFFTSRFGERIAKAIIQGVVWEGMTKEMVILAKGKPKTITRRVFANVVKEQWEYEGGLRLFFENDLLKSHGGPRWSPNPPA